jgi:lipoprotein-releasing system permease protein
MIMAIAFISGFKHEIREKLFTFWGHVHITNFNPNASNLISGDPIRYDTDLVNRVQSLPHVKNVFPYVLRPAILQAKGSMDGIKLKGITQGYDFTSRANFKGRQISFADTGYSKDILISQLMADRLKLNVSDYLQIYFLEPGATTPRIRKVQIAGIYHTGMDEVDKNFAICDLRLLQRINNWSGDQISAYQLDLDDEQYADTLASRIYNDLIEAPLTTNTMKEIFPSIFDWLQLLDMDVEILLIIMAIVAIINLAVTLLILIIEQARMVGLMTALGMDPASLKSVFLYHAGIIAALGILAGNIISIGFYYLQKTTGILRLSEATYYMSQVPVRMNWWYVILVDLATLLLCMLCMWLPSLYIRRIQPARVLQFK